MIREDKTPIVRTINYCAFLLFFVIAGCLPPILNDPLMYEPDLEIFPPGLPAIFSCPPGYTIQGATFEECSGTSFTFESITASCAQSKRKDYHF